MGRRFAVVVGIENATQTNILAETLHTQGIAADSLTQLVGNQATKTAIESRLRQLRRKLTPDDRLYLFWSGPIAAELDQNYLPTVDTQPDDRFATSVPLADLLEIGRTVPAGFFLFLDPTDVGFVPNEVSDSLADLATGIAFVSCSSDEYSQGGVWMCLIADAFSGRAAEARATSDTITVGSLRLYLEQQLSRALRAVLDEPNPQTPIVIPGGSDERTVWELADTTGTERPPVDLDRLKRAVLRAETNQKVKTLAGFQKSHRVPETSNAWAERFVGKIAQADIRADIDEVFDALRCEMGFKRKDLEAAAEDDGVGFIRSPAFDYTVTVRIDPDDPEWVIWRREVGQIREPERIQSDAFRTVFGDVFDRLVFEFAEPLDVIAFVDRIEETEPTGVSVRITSDGSQCEVTLDGFKGAVRIDTNTLRIEGSTPAESGGLVGQFFDFLQRFSSAPGVGVLPLGGPEEES